MFWKHIHFLVLLAIAALLFPMVLQAEKEAVNNAKQAISLPSKPKICLTMIVKNESRIIERCLNSVKDIVDCISICDTGSTDNTRELIEKFMESHKIPGKVHQQEWKNFGHNRTLSVEAAQKTLAELKFSFPNTYLLLLDADMILEIDPTFTKETLKGDSYFVMQRSSSVAYYNTRLLRASKQWTCVGVTHEFWACKQANKTEKLLTLSINDQEDGGCKADKYERDLALLTQGLKDEPENERYMFYLAQTHKCLKNYDEAIRWYKARIDQGGWKEEVWYSKYMIGECFDDKEDWDQALHWYLDAYQYDPDRAESLHKIALHYRWNKQHELAYLFAKLGSTIPYPKDQMLFISFPVYDYLFLRELSISSFYTKYKNEGFSAANRLALKKSAPDNIRDEAYRNLLFYVDNLKNVEWKPISIDLPLIREGLSERYNPMNPSIQKTKKGYAVIVRTVNFTQSGGQGYRSRDPVDPTIRTRNFLVHYDRDFNLLSQQEIIENLPRERNFLQVVGLEDCRMVELKNHFWFTCCTYDTHPGTVGQTLCKISKGPANKNLYVERLIPLKGPVKLRCEKNWLPFVKNNELFAVYACYPFTLYKLGLTSGDLETVYQYHPEHEFSRFRGSAGPVEFDDGYLMLVHEMVYDQQRHYLHRFVYLDDNFNIKKLSKPFTFLHLGIEYCCGMTIDHSGTKCIMTVGIEDKEAKLGVMDLSAVRSLLEPLEN